MLSIQNYRELYHPVFLKSSIFLLFGWDMFYRKIEGVGYKRYNSKNASIFFCEKSFTRLAMSMAWGHSGTR